ncbi:MAG: hypothetical protein HY296_02030 [Thaumarchaeota archaeon]|nr:hypothetical protein [Nitrososphaerota archaeon]
MSPRPKSGRPIESVELKVTFRIDAAAAKRIKELIPSASIRSDGCRIVLSGEAPAEVALRAREILETVRKVVTPQKDFKASGGATESN